MRVMLFKSFDGVCLSFIHQECPPKTKLMMPDNLAFEGRK